MPRLSRPTKHTWLALGGGLLVAFSLPPWGFWPLAFVGVALFEVSLGEDPDRGTRLRRGWLFGAGWLFPGMAWMWFLTAPGYLVAGSVFAGFHAVAALASPGGNWRVIGRPAAHTLAEALRFCFPFGGVPLASLAISQSGGPLLGIVRIGGSVLLTWVTLQIGFALAGPSPFVPQRARRRGAGAGAPQGIIAVGVVVLVVAVAALAPSGSDTGRTIRVAAVQGGGPQGTRAVSSDARLVTERHLEATRKISLDDGVEMVLWPENVIDVDDFATSQAFEAVAAEARRLNAPFLVGVTEEAPGDRFTNAQIVVTPEGEITGRYDKVRRVPFGEYVPLRGLLEAVGAPTNLVPRNAIAGTEPAYLDLPDGTRVGVVISWEVFFGGRGRDGVSHGAEMIVNPTNGSSYTWTILQTQQVASSRLRAVETGRWLAQASPTGFSAFVSPDGDVLQRTSISEQEVIIHDITIRTGDTWYVVLGDIPWVVLAALVLLMSWWFSGWRPLRSVRRRASPDASVPRSDAE